MAYPPITFLPGYRLVRGEDLNADFLAAGAATIGAGVAYYVNETIGVDTGNSGQNPNTPLATISQALTLESAALTRLGLTSAGRQSIVYVTGTIHISSTLTWSLNGTHLIGLSAPSDNDRSRISQTGSTVFSPFVTVTGSGCMFANIATFYGYDDASAQICWYENGGRNNYTNCQFLGMGHATAAAQAGSRNLKIGATGECRFVNCDIGLDTITRSAANASLEFAGGSPRNRFQNCVFPFQTSSATVLGILGTGAACIDRWQSFEDCVFINNIKSTSTAMTVLTSFTSASPGGLLMMKNPTLIGITDFGDTNGLANTYVDGGAPTAATTGIAVNPT